MTRKTMAITLLASLALVGCVEEPVNVKAIAEMDARRIAAIQDASGRLTYFKDAKTGLCFAAISSFGAHSAITVSIAAVPCDKVGHILQASPPSNALPPEETK